MYSEIEERVDKIEEYMAQLAYEQIKTEMALRSLSDEMKDFKNEMKEFKNEMRSEMKDFKNEMKDFKNEMKDFKNEMKDFKNEMKDFKNEMKDFKNEMKSEMKEFKDEMKEFKEEGRREHKNMNKQWGELANKMGTFVEDIIAPAVRPVIKEYFDCDVEYFAVNVKKRRKDMNLKGEFDVVAYDENMVFLVEAKSTPKKDYFYEFLENIEKFSRLFPEYKDKKLIPIFASLRLEDDIINLATENKVYAMAYREWEYMDILNFSEIDKER